MEYSKSPFNYTGNKFRIIKQIQQWFPQKINTMVDLFCGGCDVTINTEANHKYANDINFFLIDILKEFQKRGKESIVYIEDTIEQWKLDKDNKEAYLAFRRYWNQHKEPLDLFVLLCYSFNYQLRFNAKHEFNNPFGKDRSSFNGAIRSNLLKMLPRIEKVHFSSSDFLHFDYSVLHRNDFLYADPPYLITCGCYNDGKCGFRGWNENDETALYGILDRLSKRGVLFALSNVLEHKGNQNTILYDWQEKNHYHMHQIDCNYNNCNYHTRNRENPTTEVLITNY